MSVKDAVIKKLEGEVEAIETNIKTFLKSPTQAVPDHINYTGTVEKELEKLSSTKGKLVSLKNIKE
tara:strand:+ start:10097 stop:10294 length:198 start_codon:yes stop_codon:yes gene_type:complete